MFCVLQAWVSEVTVKEAKQPMLFVLQLGLLTDAVTVKEAKQ